MKKKDEALGFFSKGFNCSQSVFASFAPDFGVDHDLALKIACGFGAGMGRMQDTCGAVTGAYMVIGLKFGKGQDADNEKKEKTYALINEFAREFKKIHGTVICRELLKREFRGDEWRTDFIDANLLCDVCENCVRDSVDILERLMQV